MRARDLSEKTIHGYTYSVWRLLVFLDFEVQPLDIDETHIVQFLASLGAHSPSKSEYAKGVRAFFKWMTRRGYRLMNPIDDDVMPRKRPAPPQERFELEEIGRLLMAAAARDELRAWAILACFATGTRRTEFVSIRVADIRWDRMVLHIRADNAKGGKARDVDIGPWAEEALRELEARSDGDRLLNIRPSTMNTWMKQAAVDCGFPPGKLHRVHTLRASFLSILADENVPIHVIAALAGHSNVKTTSGYLAIGQRKSTRAAVQVLGGRLHAEATGG
jgi:site-specific recombinase XerD